jgi:zinc transport system substrate-binding protein
MGKDTTTTRATSGADADRGPGPAPTIDGGLRMTIRKHAPLIVVLVSLSVAAAAETKKDAAKLRVAVSVLPHAHFVERIGGEHVETTVLVGPGQSPHAYDPTPRQLEALAGCRAYFRTGIDFENGLVPRIEKLFKDLKVVDLRRGVEIRKLTSAEATAHAHAGDAHAGCVHEAGAPDPHNWLSPLNAKVQAQTIADTLAELDPPRADAFRRNLAAFHAELDQVHAEIGKALAPLKGREVFVYHPAFGYFLDAYGLKQAPVEINGKEPTARQLGELIERAKTSGVKVIFVQPQFPTKSAQAVAEAIDGAVVPLDDLAKDYLANLREMTRKIQEKFKAS